MWLAVLLAAVLAAPGRAQVVVGAEAVAEGVGLPPSGGALASGHVLAAAASGAGAVFGRYCVDVACRTSRANASALAAGLSGPPHLLLDPTGPPLLVFHRLAGQVLSVARCRDAVCADGAGPALDVARSTGVDRFMGGVAAAVDAGGAVAVLYRRVFPGHDSASQVMLLQCAHVEAAHGCQAPSAVASGAGVGEAIGPDSLALLPDGRLVVLWRQTDGMYFKVCPAQPMLCAFGVGRPVRIESSPQGSAGLFANAAAVIGNRPYFLYSVGEDAATARAHLVTCLDSECVSRRGRDLPAAIPAAALAFAGSGGPPRLVALGPNGGTLYRIQCDTSEAMIGTWQSTAPAGVASDPVLLWGALAIADGNTPGFPNGTLYLLSVRDTHSIAICSGQGYGLQDCHGPHEQCNSGNKTVGDEGTCQCLEPAVPSQDGITPSGCCGACNTPDRECREGLCMCVPPLVAEPGTGGQRDGDRLRCISPSDLPTTTTAFAALPTTTAALASSGSSGAVTAGIVFGILLAIVIVAVIVWLVWRNRRQAEIAQFSQGQASYISSLPSDYTPPPAPYSQPARASSSTSAFTPSTVPARGAYPNYDDDDDDDAGVSSVHDFL